MKGKGTVKKGGVSKGKKPALVIKDEVNLSESSSNEDDQMLDEDDKLLANLDYESLIEEVDQKGKGKVGKGGKGKGKSAAKGGTKGEKNRQPGGFVIESDSD